jgi:hypothetical protein
MCYYQYDVQNGFTNGIPNIVKYYKIKNVPLNYDNEDWFSEFSLKFNSSWDWLIPVVQKINSLDTETNLNINISSDLQTVYNSVIEFIKKYESEPSTF